MNPGETQSTNEGAGTMETASKRLLVGLICVAEGMSAQAHSAVSLDAVMKVQEKRSRYSAPVNSPSLPLFPPLELRIRTSSYL